MPRTLAVPDHTIASRIHLIRGQKVMLDADLAELYGVSTKELNLKVKRNARRFPKDFMFRMNRDEWEILRFQFETSRSWGGRRYPPTVFTEHGVLMLSSVLNSDRAIKVNIHIMRVFTRMNHLLMTDREVRLKMESMDARLNDHGLMIEELFEAAKELMARKAQSRKRFGFRPGDHV